MILKKLKKSIGPAITEWEGRAMVSGRITKARANVILTGNYIKQHLGIELNDIEAIEEEKFKR